MPHRTVRRAPAGVLTIRILPLDPKGPATVETHRYDPLTGLPRPAPKSPRGVRIPRASHVTGVTNP